jgi:hypothetical protein
MTLTTQQLPEQSEKASQYRKQLSFISINYVQIRIRRDPTISPSTQQIKQLSHRRGARATHPQKKMAKAERNPIIKRTTTGQSLMQHQLHHHHLGPGDKGYYWSAYRDELAWWNVAKTDSSHCCCLPPRRKRVPC